MNAGRPANTPDVLWSKVDVRGRDECWPWTGWIGSGGYGRTQINGRAYYAHRVIFNLRYPNKISLEAPSDRSGHGFLMHSCDNPPCCNPRHLRVSTQKENMEDRKAKGRYEFKTGGDHHRSVFTNLEIEEVIRLTSDGLKSAEVALLVGKNKATVRSLIYRMRKRA